MPRPNNFFFFKRNYVEEKRCKYSFLFFKKNIIYNKSIGPKLNQRVAIVEVPFFGMHNARETDLV